MLAAKKKPIPQARPACNSMRGFFCVLAFLAFLPLTALGNSVHSCSLKETIGVLSDNLKEDIRNQGY
jgi:hypothetical protein